MVVDHHPLQVLNKVFDQNFWVIVYNQNPLTLLRFKDVEVEDCVAVRDVNTIRTQTGFKIVGNEGDLPTCKLAFEGLELLARVNIVVDFGSISEGNCSKLFTTLFLVEFLLGCDVAVRANLPRVLVPSFEDVAVQNCAMTFEDLKNLVDVLAGTSFFGCQALAVGDWEDSFGSPLLTVGKLVHGDDNQVARVFRHLTSRAVVVANGVVFFEKEEVDRDPRAEIMYFH